MTGSVSGLDLEGKANFTDFVECALDPRGAAAEVRRLQAAEKAVRLVHRPMRMAMIGGTEWTCAECREEAMRATDITWPCSTIAALDAALAAGGAV